MVSIASLNPVRVTMSDLLPHFRPLLESDFEAIYPIEQAAHQEPWSQANLLSCFGPRYLNGLMLVDGRPAGFYISDLVAGDSSLMNICVHPDFQGRGWGGRCSGSTWPAARPARPRPGSWRSGPATAPPSTSTRARGLPNIAAAPTTMAPGRRGRMPC